MKIQFAVRASMHDPKYRRPYFKIPNTAWIAYKLERLLGSLVKITILELGENTHTVLNITTFNDWLVSYQGTARVVFGQFHDLMIGKYYIVQLEVVEENGKTKS